MSVRTPYVPGIARAPYTVAALAQWIGSEFERIRLAFHSITPGQVTLTDPAVTVQTGELSIGATTATTVGAAGGAAALPANPVGYININVGGTAYKVPYYNG